MDIWYSSKNLPLGNISYKNNCLKAIYDLFGLVINELLINVLKHGFPNNKKGEITISITIEHNEYRILFSDNGIGIPTDFDINATKTLGLIFVNNLKLQLDGKMEIRNSIPTEFLIHFPK